MSLTKEECLFALKSLKPANIYEFIAKGYLSFTEANSILTQLINEHFEVIKEKELLEEALDKACEELENLSYVKGLGQVGKNFKEWKEWCLKYVE